MDEKPRLDGDAVPLPPSVPVTNSGAMKLPVFWPGTAEVWFTQVDAQFAIKTVTVSKTIQSDKTVPQVELPFQPTGFSDLLSEPVPETAPEQCSFSLLFLQDILSDQEFLVDSGASASMFPEPKSDSSNGVCLLTADGFPMVCRGTKIIPLCFSCRRDSKFTTGHSSICSPPGCRFSGTL